VTSSTRWPALAAIVVLIQAGAAAAQESRAPESAPASSPTNDVDALLKQLESPDPEEMEAAWDALSKSGALVPNLERLLQSPNRTLLAWTMFHLIELGPAAKGSSEVVLRKLETLRRDDSLPELFLRALAAMGTPPEAIAESFKRTLQAKSEVENFFPALSVRNLFNHDRAGAWSVPVIAAVLESSDDYARMLAAKELGRYGPKAVTAVPALLAALAADYPVKGKSKDPRADAIASSYGEKGSDLFTKPKASGWAPAEESFFEYRNPYVWAIARAGPSARTAVLPLLEIAANGHVALRPDALRALATIAPANSDVQKLATGWLSHPNPFLRLGAEDAVRILGPRAAGARKDLVKLLADARPYELRAIFRALDAVGDVKPDLVALVEAVKKPKPDAASIAAAHSLGMIDQPDAALLAALQEGLKSAHPALVCAAAYSLGRLVPTPAAAAKDLLAVLRKIEVDEDMMLWDATKAAFVTEALGRLGSASAEARDRMMRMMREIKAQRWPVLTLSGLTEELIARTCWMIRQPPDALTAPAVVDASVESDPPWFGDWAQKPPDAGVVLWGYQPSSDHLMLQFGAFPDLWADWSTVPEDGFAKSVVLSIRREEEGLDVRLLDRDFAVLWALQRAPETRPSALYRLEARSRPADLDTAERLDLDFRVREIKDLEHDGQRYPSYRWRGGFSIPNPFRKSPK
jgi:hypothetical protein